MLNRIDLFMDLPDQNVVQDGRTLQVQIERVGLTFCSSKNANFGGPRIRREGALEKSTHTTGASSVLQVHEKYEWY